MKASIKSLLLKTSLLLLSAATTHADNFTVLHSFGITNKITGAFPSAMLTQSPEGTLYGIDGSGTTLYYTGTQYRTAQQADYSVNGTVFAVNPDGNGFKTLHIFTNTLDGSNGAGGLVLVGDTLYGTTSGGGAHYGGTVFRINTNGSGFTHLYDFGGVTNDASYPTGSLVHSNGILYGTTLLGGQYGLGTVFSISTNGGTPSNLVTFNGTNGSQPWAGLTLVSNTLFGSTRSGSGGLFKVNINGSGFSVIAGGVSLINPLFLTNDLMYGASELGNLFSLRSDGSGFTTIHTFPSPINRNAAGHLTNSEGYNPACVVVVSNQIYGVTDYAGTNGYGTIFSINTNGSGFNVIKTLDPTTTFPFGTMMLGDRIYGTLSTGGHGYGFLFSLNLDGSGYTNFFNFAGSDGQGPVGELLVTNGLLYGAATFGGDSGYGMIYQLGTNGTGYTNLHSFGPDTSLPSAGPILLSNTIYGTTGSYWNGTSALFALSPDGSVYTNLYIDNEHFLSSPVTAGGKLFVYSAYAQYTTGFSMGTNGQNLTSLFGSESGASPLAVFGDVVYGTIIGDPGTPYGYLFSYAGSNTFHSLYVFQSKIEGNYPAAPPLPVGNMLYGTTLYGGIYTNGIVYSVGTNGSNFNILHTFSGADGRYPRGPLVLVNGVLYGTTSIGGAYGWGNVFSVNTNGSGFAAHHSFTGGADGGNVTTGLHLSGHTLYGNSYYGGNMGMGVVFAITAEPVLSSQIFGANLILSWPDPNYSLQSAPAATGSYTTIPGATSPYTNALTGTQLFFRLISN